MHTNKAISAAVTAATELNRAVREIYASDLKIIIDLYDRKEPIPLLYQRGASESELTAAIIRELLKYPAEK